MDWKKLAGPAALVLAAVEVFLDFDTWIQLNVSIVFGLPLVVAAAARSRRLVWGLALALAGATFVVYSRQMAPGAFSLHEPYFVNRVLAALALLITAGLAHALIALFDALEARRRNAEEASRRKTRLLASVSHDMRTPLTTINLMAETIRVAAENPAQALKVPGFAEQLQRSAASLADLVTDVLDLAQIDSGRVELHESEVTLDELLAEQCRDMAYLAEAKGLRLVHQPSARPLRLRADPVKLARVVRNLMNNAVQYTSDGSVTVSSGVTPLGEPLVVVRDTGPGIAPEHCEAVFGEFSRLESGVHGWGLGLAICRRLVLLMGGTITLESEPGRGSAFVVRLPARTLAPESEAAVSAAA